MLRILILIILIWTASFEAKPFSTKDLPRENFTRIGNKFYFIEESNRVNWFWAGNFCRQLGGFLANLENEDELNALSKHLHPSKSYWLSLNELAVKGIYSSQATGREASYLNWSAGQPDNVNGLEHCVELWRPSNSFQMNDAQCEIHLHFVCELD